MKDQTVHVSSCQFTRNGSGTWERGIAFISEPGLSDVRLLIDLDLKEVSYAQLDDYILTPYLGAQTFIFPDTVRALPDENIPNESECDKSGIHSWVKESKSLGQFEVFWIDNNSTFIQKALLKASKVGWYWNQVPHSPDDSASGPFNTSNEAYDDAMNSEFSD